MLSAPNGHPLAWWAICKEAHLEPLFTEFATDQKLFVYKWRWPAALSALWKIDNLAAPFRWHDQLMTLETPRTLFFFSVLEEFCPDFHLVRATRMSFKSFSYISMTKNVQEIFTWCWGSLHINHCLLLMKRHSVTKHLVAEINPGLPSTRSAASIYHTFKIFPIPFFLRDKR